MQEEVARSLLTKQAAGQGNDLGLFCGFSGEISGFLKQTINMI